MQVTDDGRGPEPPQFCRSLVFAADQCAHWAPMAAQAVHHGCSGAAVPAGCADYQDVVHRRNSKINRVVLAVATRFPDASVTSPSANPIRDPALTTDPTAVNGPLSMVTALR